MEVLKIFFYSNLRFLRERKRFSQEDFAALMGIKRTKLHALESGQTKNPTAEDLLKFSDHFKISIDALMRMDLTLLNESEIRTLQAANKTYLTGSQLRVLAITVDKHNKENAEYVPIKAKAGYRSGYNNPEFIASLPKLSLPNLPKHGTYRMFPTTGDSMLPIPEGSDVIAQYVQDWNSLKPETPSIVILKGEQDFVFKLVTVQEDGTLLLKSLNKAYEPYTVDSHEVLEVWKYLKHQTGTIPEPETDMQEIKAMLQDLKNELKIKNRNG
ncbi:DNA-binding protein [Taibaiella sp. KBW10]|uniref:XRE family transcriptional regulator n=1 Tax=Taibaiella sp. KBW10 TaxID=2153357 RepID=UPI000F597524|nr:LexA family transcriptional regulator [Taibaiella sp. KBW10]RQO31958.1 DNA-binding protein [Taibaiella sp. KBW10]